MRSARGPFAAGIAISFVFLAHVLQTWADTSLYEYWLESSIGAPVYAVLGALIVSRRPDNRIGWLFLAVGVGSSLQFLLGQYATSGLETGYPWVGAAAALSVFAQIANVSGFLFLAYLYPSGSLPSPRWRPFLIAAAVAFALSGLSQLVEPGAVEGFPGSVNPFGIHGAGDLLRVAGLVGAVIALPVFVAALAALLVRWRGAQGIERLQIKTFLYGTVLGFCLILFGNILIPASLEGETGGLVWTLGPLMLPLSAAVAILRYRLYDIDLVINRTLVYGSLSAILAAFYVSLVFGLQAILAPFTAESDIAVAASTLAVAALFRPLRGRVQSFIDHRFYRRKFDAQRTLEDFNSHLRDEVDLRALSSRLEGVVQETMQPTHVSLWLRTGEL